MTGYLSPWLASCSEANLLERLRQVWARRAREGDAAVPAAVWARLERVYQDAERDAIRAEGDAG